MRLNVIYSSNNLEDMVRNELNSLNYSGWPEVSLWSVKEFMSAIKDYMDAHSHSCAKNIWENIHLEESSKNPNVKNYYETVTLYLMLKDAEAREYMNALYEKALRTKQEAMKKYMEESKQYGTECLMYRGFFDMAHDSKIPQPTEYMDITDKEATIFRADHINKFLDMAHVEKEDTFTLERLRDGKNGDPYLILKVYKADGAMEEHTMIPTKWLPKDFDRCNFVKS